jgi:hypothetical protein
MLMKNYINAAAPITLAVLISTFASTLQAGQIVNFNWYSGVASVCACAVVPPVTPNNDNVIGLSPNEFFITQKNYTAIGPVDLTFDVINSGATTEYAFREGVFNGTGVPWVGYHIELGFGHDATFTKSTIGDDLDFDAPHYDSGLLFNPPPTFAFPIASILTEDDIIASGGVMPNGGFAGDFRFSVDVPDGITQFTIRQSPIGVPEPGSILLGVFGLAPAALRRRRRL